MRPLQPNQTPWLRLRNEREHDLKAAGPRAAVPARNGYAIGYHHYPRQYRSSQLRDSRMAVRIRPAME